MESPTNLGYSRAIGNIEKNSRIEFLERIEFRSRASFCPLIFQTSKLIFPATFLAFILNMDQEFVDKSTKTYHCCWSTPIFLVTTWICQLGSVVKIGQEVPEATEVT